MKRVADTGKKRAPALSPPASVPFTSSSPNQEQGVAAGMTDGDDDRSGRIHEHRVRARWWVGGEVVLGL